MISDLYKELCDKKSDINEHLPTLRKLAGECNHITEFGVRTGLSTVAILDGMKEWAKLISYDFVEDAGVRELEKFAIEEWKDFSYIIADTRELDIDSTDMLFIDTLHNGDQLAIELDRAASKVRKYIVFHDTETFGKRWEEEWHDGLQWAMDSYLKYHNEWVVKKVYYNNNGLTVWERKANIDCIVFTAIFGNYDILKVQPNQDIRCRYICFTDRLDLHQEIGASDQWELVLVEDNDDMHNRMKAKYFRTHPFMEIPDWKWEPIIYMDGTARLLRWDSISYFIDSMLEKSDILCIKHPERDCIYDEAEFIAGDTRRWKKYNGLPVLEQVDSYKKLGYPSKNGLSATGLLVMRDNTKLAEFLNEWYNECIRWTYQDQLSFDYLINRLGIKRQWLNIEGNLWDNEYISFLSAHMSDE
jgi:hypothetical protein